MSSTSRPVFPRGSLVVVRRRALKSGRTHIDSHFPPHPLASIHAAPARKIALPSQHTIDDARCVLVTGATSGIGRALALAIAALPSHPTAVATGRRKDRLAELREHAGIEPLELELGGALEPLKEAVDALLAQYPKLDTLILNAGIQYEIDMLHDTDVMDKVTQEFAVNYTSVVAMITYVLPHFLKLSAEGRPTTIVVVTSGLGIIPAPTMINYSASKAALHSFSSSLRLQLQDTNVRVVEIVPPLVESDLHAAQGRSEMLSKIWMPLTVFTETTMQGLRKGDNYVLVGRSVDSFAKFEAGKDEISKAMMMQARASRIRPSK